LKKKLYYVFRFKYIYDCIAFEETVARALVKVDNCVPCILDLHKRIIEKMTKMVYYASLDEVSTINKTARKRQARKIAGFMNTMAYGDEEDPGNYKVPYHPKTGKIAEVKFDDSRLKQLELNLPKIFPKILSKEPNNPEWIWFQEKISDIMTTLGQKRDFTDAQISQLQIDIDVWNLRWWHYEGEKG
jgi:hypothetical protein